ncbi:hypothetical protein ACFWHQ_17690 [Streptomyces sp. NPDC060334]|uniref:hypothetical protein n=1 Tax=unclassified Streptomyces TaxID=2593676 RepID=UPI003332EC16
MTAVANDLKTGRSLVSVALFDSIAEFTVTHFGYAPTEAEQATDQALAFLATVGTATVKMVPSDDVDGALHSFILHTVDYREFCETYAGRFLEHNPRPGGGGRVQAEVQATAHAIKANGFMVLDSLWTVNGANAALCDSDCGRDYRAV